VRPISSKWIQYFLILILFIILVALVKVAFTPVNSLPKKNVAANPTSTPTVTPKAADLCEPFTADKSRVSCKEAVKLALKKYSGDVKVIKSEIVLIFTDLPNSDSSAKKESWIIDINLKTPLKINETANNSIEIFVVKEDGKLQEHSFSSGKY
jgi:hypothetical protein